MWRLISWSWRPVPCLGKFVTVAAALVIPAKGDHCITTVIPAKGDLCITTVIPTKGDLCTTTVIPAKADLCITTVIPVKGDLCITTVIPAKAGIQGWGWLLYISNMWKRNSYQVQMKMTYSSA